MEKEIRAPGERISGLPERILERLSSQRFNFPKIHYNVCIESYSIHC